MECLSIGPISRIDSVDVRVTGGSLQKRTISRPKFSCRFVTRTRIVNTCSISILASILRSCPTLPDPGGFLFLCGRTRQYEARLDDSKTMARYRNNGDSTLPHPSYTDRFPPLVPKCQPLPLPCKPGYSNKVFPRIMAANHSVDGRPCVVLFKHSIRPFSGCHHRLSSTTSIPIQLGPTIQTKAPFPRR
jgi:hypothetical protein